MATQLSGNAGYSWWNRPLFLQAPTNLYYTGIGTSQYWRVYQNSSSTYDNLDQCPEQDDHNAPAVIARSGKDRWAFASRHGKSRVVNKFKATSGINFSDDGNLNHPEGSGVAYVQIADYVTDENIAVFSRVNDITWRFFRSTNWGTTWSESRQLFNLNNDSTQKKYMLLTPTSTVGVYHLAVYGHPVVGSWRAMCYGRVSMITGNVANASGTIANLDGTDLPLDENSLDDIAPTSGTERARMFDVGEAHGFPIICYAKWDDPNSIPATYYFAYRDSSLNWHHVNTTVLCGAAFYSPSKYYAGMSIDKNGNNRLFIAREALGVSTIENYSIINTAGVLSLGTPSVIATSSTHRLVRPYAFEDGDDVAWQKLVSYTNFNNYSIEYWKEDL